jgi:hypothetical protein
MEVFVSDLRHFLDLPGTTPGPARKMAEHLGSVVRAATATNAGTVWVSALTCRRRPGNRACPGHIAVFRADLPAPIEWKCTSCGDDGSISGWEDSPSDLRRPRSERAVDIYSEIVVSDDVAAALRDLQLLDSDCERLVFQARVTKDGIVVAGSDDDLDELIGFVAAEANQETNRRRQKRLDAAFDALNEAVAARDPRRQNRVPDEPSMIGTPTMNLTGRWRITEMDLWDLDAVELVGPAFIELNATGTGTLGFIAVTGTMDCRQTDLDGRPAVEFTWDGDDDGDRVSGRGWATLNDDGSVHGHIYFHHGDDSGFRATRVDSGPRRRTNKSALRS